MGQFSISTVLWVANSIFVKSFIDYEMSESEMQYMSYIKDQFDQLVVQLCNMGAVFLFYYMAEVQSLHGWETGKYNLQNNVG